MKFVRYDRLFDFLSLEGIGHTFFVHVRTQMAATEAAWLSAVPYDGKCCHSLKIIFYQLENIH